MGFGDGNVDAQHPPKAGAGALKASQPAATADKDPDVVCVSFKEGLSEDWCYTACTNGVCPPKAAKDCMCGKAEPTSQAQQGQQRQSGKGKDRAVSGAAGGTDNPAKDDTWADAHPTRSRPHIFFHMLDDVGWYDVGFNAERTDRPSA